MAQVPRILIAGVGNLLLTDDGIGVHAVQELQKEPMAGVKVVDIGTAVLHGLHFLEDADRVLIIDAAHGDGPPGTIYLFDTAQSHTAVNSVHAMGLREAVRLLPPGVRAPGITVLGVEPASLEYGIGLSPTLRQVLPRVRELAIETVQDWLKTASVESAAIQTKEIVSCL